MSDGTPFPKSEIERLMEEKISLVMGMIRDGVIGPSSDKYTKRLDEIEARLKELNAYGDITNHPL
ncbi:MAG: hypothetical protein ACYC3A_03100 [Halothiobacillus sp.]